MIFLLLASAPAVADDGGQRALAALKAGAHYGLMRHAKAPGRGDPETFRLGDCATQRNLSPAGRDEARRLGERLRAEGVVVDKAYASPWCRCRDTADLAFGKSEEWEALSSFFDRREREPELTKRVKNRIGTYSTRRPKGNIAMVTHHVNIQALTGHAVGTGEMVVVRPDGCCGLKTVGRIAIR
ncbi:MAG TPA: histidine phosphatase family protein [Usitatibacteraceae bacterium]|nr:histidine phosphatase family protein [Usitatibacteraceae bacterium]